MCLANAQQYSLKKNTILWIGSKVYEVETTRAPQLLKYKFNK
jgi:hypothetical protein